MPYTPTVWQDGITLGNQTHMNNLEGQYSEATKSNNADLLAPYVMSGLAVTRHNSYASNVLADTPLRYYRLDESSGTAAFDSSGNGQNGSYTNGPTLGVAGALTGDPDTAATFNGTNQYVTVPTGGLPPGPNTFSLEAWFKVSAAPASTKPFLFMGSDPSTANKAAYMAINSSGKLEGGTWAASFLQSGSAVSLNAWHHAVLTFTGGTNGTLTLYLDGTSQGTATGTPNITYQGSSTIGAGWTGSAPENYFSGSVDEACIYGTALSSTRITAHYNAGTTATTQVDMTSGTAYPAQTDGTTRQRAINSASFTTVTPSTTYYLYAQPDGTTYWNTANTPAANSLAIAQVTTDGSGNVSVVTDKRTLNPMLLPNAAGQIKTPGLASVAGQATVGAFGVPVTVAQALQVRVTTTGAQSILTFTPPADGLYMLLASFVFANGSATTLDLYATYTDPVTLGGPAAIVGSHSGDVFGLSMSSSAGTSVPCRPISFYAKGGSVITVTFNDHSGTPNDTVTVMLQRLT